MLEFFKPYKGLALVIGSILVVLAIFFGGKKLYSHIYNSGVEYQKSEQKIANEIAQRKADSDRVDLNKKLDSLRLENEQLEARLQEKIGQGTVVITKYLNTQQSKAQCLDNAAIDVYNQSVPE